MHIFDFEVDRELKGSVIAGLHKETIKELMEYLETWGEEPEKAGFLKLEIWRGKPGVHVDKRNVPEGQPHEWSNQNWKDKETNYRRR